MNRLKVFAWALGYKLFRTMGWPKLPPINLTFSITNRCNSRCRTCNIWRMDSSNELSTDEIDEIFKKLGSVYILTLSGGEPFLRKDITEICRSAHDNCKPSVIVIPTNGILYEIIPKKVVEILEACPKSHIVINLSLDGIGEQHDEIRGVKGNFERAMKTYMALRSLSNKNFELGIHTVISVFNVHNFPQIYEEIRKLKPDSYITEIAERRVELDTVNMSITPSWEDYSKAIDYLCRQTEKQKFKGFSKIIQAFRLEYYELVKRVLKEEKQIIPCYAGLASAQIAPNGDVWFCCIKAESVGNLRDFDYDFKKIWFGERANKLRNLYITSKCYCALANASYTNMLCSFKTLAKVVWRWLIWRTS